MDHWRQVREALLDFTWRDKYARWYLILTLMWWVALCMAVPRLVEQYSRWTLAVLFLGWFGQRLIGKMCDTLQAWNEGEFACDCPTCTEQRTGGVA